MTQITCVDDHPEFFENHSPKNDKSQKSDPFQKGKSPHNGWWGSRMFLQFCETKDRHYQIRLSEFKRFDQKNWEKVQRDLPQEKRSSYRLITVYVDRCVSRYSSPPVCLRARTAVQRLIASKESCRRCIYVKRGLSLAGQEFWPVSSASCRETRDLWPSLPFALQRIFGLSGTRYENGRRWIHINTPQVKEYHKRV